MTLSLWLELPQLQPVVDELAVEVGNPSFVPHLTLVGALPTSDAAELYAVTRRLAPPAEVRLSAFGTKHEESRFVCLTVEKSAELDATFATLHAGFPETQDEHFAGWPHASLLYGTDRARQRWPDPLAVAARFGDTLYGRYRPAAISVWDTTGDVSSWRRGEPRREVT